MPRLSDTMEEGLVVRWLKSPGDPVTSGEPLVEVETDKVTMVVESPGTGVLATVIVSEGDNVPPGAALGAIGDEVDAARPKQAPSDDDSPSRGLAADSTPTEVTPFAASGTLSSHVVRATPLARRVARALGVTIEAFGPGSGPAGRILRSDVERRVGQAQTPVLAEDLVIEPTRLQRTIARRMTQSKQEIPHYYVDAEIDVTRAQSLRRELDVSFTAVIVRAVAIALREHPRVNASWVNDTIVRRSAVNVGVAVALDDDGLVVPVIRHVDELPLVATSAEIVRLSDCARAGSLTMDDVMDATFTVSSLGSFGIDAFHAVIDPPQSGILAVGAARQRPVVVDGGIHVREVVQLSLSADHRVFSGATAAAFLGAIRRLLEEPSTLA